MMTYLKYVSYVYLVVAAFFVYSGIVSLTENNNGEAVVSFGIGAVSIFMFFFRRHFGSKYSNQNKNK